MRKFLFSWSWSSYLCSLTQAALETTGSFPTWWLWLLGSSPLYRFSSQSSRSSKSTSWSLGSSTREAIIMMWNACRWSSNCSSYKMCQGGESTLQTRCSTKIKPILIIIINIIINIVDIGIKILTDQNIWKYRRTERSRVARSSLSFSSATSLSGWAEHSRLSNVWKFERNSSERVIWYFQNNNIVLKISNNSFRTISFKLYHSRLQVIYTFEVQKVEESPVQVRSSHSQLHLANWLSDTCSFQLSTFNWHLSTFNWYVSTCSHNLSTCNQNMSTCNEECWLAINNCERDFSFYGVLIGI